MSSTTAPIRTAIVGYGLAGSAFHAPLIAADPAFELAAIVTANPDRRAQARATHPAATLLDGPDELFARARELALDLVVVASPNRTHVELANRALDHDRTLHVVVDKPLAASVEEARALANHANARNRLLTVFHNRRWDGDFLTARRLIDRGDLGEVVRWESHFDRWRPAPRDGAWRELPDPAEAGGLLFDLGTHVIDQSLLLFGPARTVYAEIDVRRPSARVDDDVFVAVTHDSGVRSHHWVTNLAAQPAPRLRVLGTAAAYVKHGLDVQEAALRDGAGPNDPGFGTEAESAWGTLGVSDDGELLRVRTEPGRYAAFYEGVAAALNEGAPPPVSAAEAIAVLEVLEAARASSRTQTTITLR
jgi:scyllo-inositol 2-dehydrogenase (NADP+)